MCQTVVHRGPDEDGQEIVDNVALGMRRLAIIDLRGGSQPIRNESGTIRVVFNGEIYNFREIRSELEKAGHRFRTNSDTEVLVHAYERYGDDFVSRLNGMFAFALHDMERKRLLIARDQVGIKPLFYFRARDEIVFGSEIKALLTTGRVPRELDPDALAEFFSWEYVPGAATLFRDVKKLEPGHMIVADLQSRQVRDIAYWDPPVEPEDETPSLEEWVDRVDEAIETAVRRQMIADVPLGAFLSGGVDSSLVVAAMGDARTFSIGFDDPSYNELQYSAEVASHLGVSHETEVIQPHVADIFEHLMNFMDDPIGDFSIFPTFLVSRLAREHVTVALSGDGGDELFAGYETYVADGVARRLQAFSPLLNNRLTRSFFHRVRPTAKKKGLVNKAKRFAEGMGEDPRLGHARWRIFLGEQLRGSFFTNDINAASQRPAGSHILGLFEKSKELHPVNQSLYVDTRSYLVDNCLVKTDRMSMAVSLEARVPLLDIDLAELAFRIPGALKLDGNETKTILKRIAERKIPRRCVYRPKEGFSIPIKHWLGTQFRPFLEEATDPARLRRDGIFQADTISRLKREHLGGKANHSHLLWSLVVFDQWKSMWLEGTPT